MKDAEDTINDSRPAAGLTVGELRELLRRELQATVAPNDSEDSLITVEEAARRLGYSKDWLYRNKHKFPFFKRVGRKLGFSSHGISKFLNSPGKFVGHC